MKLPQATADLVAADGLPRVVTADDGSVHVLYLENSRVRSMLASEWPPPLPSDPTPAQIAQAIAARQAAEAQARADGQALRQQIITLAQSAVGVRVDQLTAAQVRAILVCLAWKQGAVAANNTIQPLASWLEGV